MLQNVGLILHDGEQKMKGLFAVFLALALVGCAESGNFDREKPIKLAAPVKQTLHLAKPIRRESLGARAEALKTDANERTNSSSLMECVSEACKTQCAPGSAKETRPKWCMFFKESVDRHASETHRKSTE